MSWIEQYGALARYNRLMNAKLYRLAGTLADGERKRDRGAFFGSIHGTFNHLLLADRIWMARFTGEGERFTSLDSEGNPIAFRSLSQELYADFAALSAERVKTDGDILTFVQALDADTLQKPLAYRTTAGTAQEQLLWWLLTHFFNHQTHHRGQVTTLLKQAGVDPGSTDLIAMLRDEEGFARA
jgi:uncharacterized damage-inducible protein DinB